jgi:hypothetical protein
MLNKDFVFVDGKAIPDARALSNYLKNRVYFFFGDHPYLPNTLLGYGDKVFYNYRGQDKIQEDLHQLLSYFPEEKQSLFLFQPISIDLHGIEAGQWLEDSIADHFEHAKNIPPQTFEQTAIHRVLEELFDEGPLNPVDMKAWLYWLQWTGLLLPPLHAPACPEGDLRLSDFINSNKTNPTPFT